MKATNHRSGALRSGFTLIEVITVIGIIMVLAAMTIGGLNYANRKAELERSRVFLGIVSQTLEQYKADVGFYPQGDGEEGSTSQVYIALYGDGELEFDPGSEEIVIKTEPDGKPDDGATVYLSTLDPNVVGKSQNVREGDEGYILVDAWKDSTDRSLRQEIFYRHDPKGDDDAMMNPPGDFDLWSLGPDGKGGPEEGTVKERSDDLNNWK